MQAQIKRKNAIVSRARGHAGSVLALAIVLTMAACSTSESDDDGSGGGGDITLAALLPMSGPAAEIGQAFERGIELAVDRVNDEGGVEIDGDELSFELRVSDTESTTQGAARAVQQEMAAGRKIWLGPVLSADFVSTYETLRSSGDFLVMSPATASESYLAPDGDLLFKTQASQTTESLAEFAEYLATTYRPERVAMLQTKDTTGDAVGEGFRAGFNAEGVEVVYDEQVDVTTTDYVPFITGIERANPDMVILPYLDSVATPFVDQAVRVGLTEPVFACQGCSSAAVAGHESEINSLIWRLTTRSVTNPDDPSTAEFRAAYKAKYNEEPSDIDFYSLSFYDAILALAAAMEEAGTAEDVKAIGAALETVSDWPGQVLDMHFDEKGLAEYPIQVATMTDGDVTFTDTP